MTGKRYFYTDPLAAAWMAKHFGMRFNNAFWHRYLECTEEITDMYDLTKGPVIGMFNIHPDSLHLLEPQGSDLTEAGIWRALDKTIAPADNRIIQRNGIAFHWPESDEA